jgi:hypothetical protein
MKTLEKCLDLDKPMQMKDKMTHNWNLKLSFLLLGKKETLDDDEIHLVPQSSISTPIHIFKTLPSSAAIFIHILDPISI